MSIRVANEIAALTARVTALEALVSRVVLLEAQLADAQALLRAMTRASTPRKDRAA